LEKWFVESAKTVDEEPVDLAAKSSTALPAEQPAPAKKAKVAVATTEGQPAGQVQDDNEESKPVDNTESKAVAGESDMTVQFKANGVDYKLNLDTLQLSADGLSANKKIPPGTQVYASADGRFRKNSSAPVDGVEFKFSDTKEKVVLGARMLTLGEAVSTATLGLF
jgi:ABC-type uncharacterized transport system involved in gliding motility auxiliary subunit